ncbi:MAG TPA: hypothetical protein GX507_11215 [Clostridia bacterium]|nr:hypothetical protein [Clostridia bacterium]
MPSGVGSLPLTDVKTALKVVFETFPECPHWPQLPKLKEEYFVTQFLGPLLDLDLLEFSEGKGWGFKDKNPDFVDNMTRFYEWYLESEEPGGNRDAALDRFAMTKKGARGFYAFLEAFGGDECLSRLLQADPLVVKGQIIGPVSAGFLLHDAEGKASFYRPDLRDILVKCLKKTAQWQVRRLGAVTGKRPMVFVDEAFLSAYGSQMFVSLDRRDIVEALDEMLEGIEAEGGISGVHACTGGEWSILFETRANVVNTDVYGYFTSILGCLDAFNGFLERGGIFAWGVVPTSEAATRETVETIVHRLVDYMVALKGKGVNEKRLSKQSIVTPSCGTGTLSEELALRIYELTKEVAARLRDDMPLRNPNDKGRYQM